MTLVKFTATAIAASLVLAGSAQAAPIRASGAMPVAGVSAKKLSRTSAPVVRQSRNTSAILIGLLAAGAVGYGVYEVSKSDSTGS